MGTMLKYGSEGAKQFYEMYRARSRACQGTPGGRYPHPRPGLPHPDHHLLPDRHASSSSTDGFSTGHGFLREPNDIQSYSALACIAIQSNQNDQHGGQSIPNFDYGMAIGVAKTYCKLYTEQSGKGLPRSWQTSRIWRRQLTRDQAEDRPSETGVKPRLAASDGLLRAVEAPYLAADCRRGRCGASCRSSR